MLVIREGSTGNIVGGTFCNNATAAISEMHVRSVIEKYPDFFGFGNLDQGANLIRAAEASRLQLVNNIQVCPNPVCAFLSCT